MILSLGSRKFDLSQGVSIALPIKAGAQSVNAWYLDPVDIKPVEGDGFIGDVSQGGSVNFRDIYFNPHGHGTHTESVGHISKAFHSINTIDCSAPCLAQLVSVQPEVRGEDQVITLASLGELIDEADALVIRTLPNAEEKRSRHYSNSNPPFLDVEVIPKLNEMGVKHLLIDTPSVDKEQDDGALACHHAYWNYPEAPSYHRTITELIYVPDHVKDGIYALQLFVAAFENDAAPSNPHLFAEIE